MITWSCPNCGTVNSSGLTACELCAEPRPRVIDPAVTFANGPGALPGFTVVQLPQPGFPGRHDDLDVTWAEQNWVIASRVDEFVLARYQALTLTAQTAVDGYGVPATTSTESERHELTVMRGGAVVVLTNQRLLAAIVNGDCLGQPIDANVGRIGLLSLPLDTVDEVHLVLSRKLTGIKPTGIELRSDDGAEIAFDIDRTVSELRMAGRANQREEADRVLRAVVDRRRGSRPVPAPIEPLVLANQWTTLSREGNAYVRLSEGVSAWAPPPPPAGAPVGAVAPPPTVDSAPAPPPAPPTTVSLLTTPTTPSAFVPPPAPVSFPPPPEAPAAIPSVPGALSCPACGNPLDESDTFCGGCGTRAPLAVDTRAATVPTSGGTCGSCGTSFEAGDRFCSGCGATLA